MTPGGARMTQNDPMMTKDYRMRMSPGRGTQDDLKVIQDGPEVTQNDLRVTQE